MKAPARVAMFGLVVHAAFVMWADWSANLDSRELLAASLVLFAVIGGVVTCSLFWVAREQAHVGSFAGAAIWALGWALNTITTMMLAWWLLTDRALHVPDFGILPLVATAIGGAIVGAFTLRGTAATGPFVLGVLALVAYVAISSFTIMLEHELLDGAATLLARDLGVAFSSLALAAVLWLYERAKPGDPVPRARVVS